MLHKLYLITGHFHNSIIDNTYLSLQNIIQKVSQPVTMLGIDKITFVGLTRARPAIEGRIVTSWAR